MGSRRLACPACQAAMGAHTLSGVEIDRCPDCQGIYFDAGELAAAARSTLPPVVTKEPSSRHCPVCRGAMEVARMAEVEIDWCQACVGIFLDAGEYDRLRRGRAPIRRKPREMLDDDGGAGGGAAVELGLLALLVAFSD